MNSILAKGGLIAALTVYAALPCATADAGIVYLLDGASDRVLTVDSTTGNIQNSYAAPIAFGSVAGLSGAEGGTTLIFTDGSTPGTPLFRLNPANGAVLSSHALNIAFRGGLSYEGPTILSVNDGAPLIRQNGFGGATSAAPAASLRPSAPGALGGDDTGRHFLASGGSIFETDLNGVALSNLGNQTRLTLSGLAFDGTNLYAVSTSSRTLFTLNPTNGAVLQTVNVGSGPGGFSGAAVAVPVVPLPPAAWMGLAGLGVAGLLRRRRRQSP